MRSELRDQLSSLVKRAELVARDDRIAEAREQYKDIISAHLLRLRPSAGSFSVVSCAPRTPQLGKSKLRSAAGLENYLKGLGAGTITLVPPNGKLTPEKDLQSWLLAAAMANGGELAAISSALNDGCRYWVVSDELAFRNDSSRLVADLLLVREDADGVASLANVELKYARSMKTFEQVANFRRILECEELQSDWRRFAELMTGRSFQWSNSAQTRGVVIWLALSGGKSTPTATQKKIDQYKRIDVLGYTKLGPGAFALSLETRQ